MGKRALAVLLAVVLAACTRVVDGPPPRSRPPVAPLTAGQVGDLLSPDVQDKDGNLFVTVEPEECSGVAKEVDPPFIFDLDPAATDGGHWVATDGRDVFIEEMAGVYPADFDADEAIAKASHAVESCRDVPFTVTSMMGRTYSFRLLPPVDSGSPNILAWSFTGSDWACDSAFVAAHNAAVGISTCGEVNGYDVLGLARDALERIEKLANTTA